MKVYIAGNPFVKGDSLPLTLLPQLKEAFPHLSFEEVDPNENFVPEERSIIIDTVKGIGDVRWFNSLDDFMKTKSVTAHDYDLGLHLQLLKKLGKVRQLQIIGIPQQAKVDVSLQLTERLKWVLSKNKSSG